MSDDLILSFPVLKTESGDFLESIVYTVDAVQHQNDRKLIVTHSLKGESFIAELIKNNKARFLVTLFYKDNAERQNFICDDWEYDEDTGEVGAEQNIDIDFIHNKSAGAECTIDDRENTNGHLYPDIRFDCLTFNLIVEIDEFRHKGSNYNCDERRMYDIIAKLGMLCVFIRYNPDNKDSNKNNLLKEINKYLEYNYEEIDFDNFGLKIKYMFYK